jgi:hypothetical protein
MSLDVIGTLAERSNVCNRSSLNRNGVNEYPIDHNDAVAEFVIQPDEPINEPEVTRRSLFAENRQADDMNSGAAPSGER